MNERDTRETIDEESPYLLADYWLDRYNEGKVSLASAISRIAMRTVEAVCKPLEASQPDFNKEPDKDGFWD